ncbi:hypothetical protein BDZ91DRAFT_847072 [Kalaharituber pfeilii]|nr:hypothetical protein BDZ91DRAFT_847072 [Kalaharituber pfeilii]
MNLRGLSALTRSAGRSEPPSRNISIFDRLLLAGGVTDPIYTPDDGATAALMPVKQLALNQRRRFVKVLCCASPPDGRVRHLQNDGAVMDIPSVIVIPTPHSQSKFHPNDSTPSHYHSRHFSTSSFISQYSQRTQSTVQAIPTRPFAYAYHWRGGGSFASSAGRGSRAAKHLNASQELESQATKPGRFQYATTPSAGELLKADQTPENLMIRVPVLVLRSRLSPCPLRTVEKDGFQIRIWEGVKVLENIVKKP